MLVGVLFNTYKCVIYLYLFITTSINTNENRTEEPDDGGVNILIIFV